MTNKRKLVVIFFMFCISIVIIPQLSVLHPKDYTNEPISPNISALNERRAYAIIVGIEDYPAPVNDLYYTIDDADSIYSRLYNNFGFDDTPIGYPYIQYLTDSDATKADIENAFDWVALSIQPYDIFFFYFSGHGLTSSIPGLAYLVPYDSDRIYSTDIDSYLDSVNCSEQYIIIDSCGSGGMIDDAQAPNRFFMTASARNEDSWEISALNHGVFTYYFLQSFTQASDSNGDGTISMEEQFSYVYPRTVSYSTNLGSVHHPQKYDGISGESVIDTTIGDLVLTPNGTKLEYSFYLYGHGTITTVEITVCTVGESYSTETIDLIAGAPSSTGFGFYSGNIVASGSDNITGYKIRIVVDWPKNPPGDPKQIVYTFTGEDTDGDTLGDFFEIENGLNPLTNDTDSDGLADNYEFYGVTDPNLNDTDGDGMLDGYEVFNGLNPLINDSLSDLDGDGLLNYIEYNLGTSANNSDTDGDSMDDGYEFEYGLNLLANDAGLDLDGDGLSNGIECQIGSMANNSDSDGDTMPDSWEYSNNLNLLLNDTDQDKDNDGLTNLFEYQLGSTANNADTDGDGMPDGWEYYNGLNILINDASLDLDHDDLTNLEEYSIGTDINNSDSDGDALPDGWEVQNNLNPLLNDAGLDADNDGLTNLEEYQINTDPHLEDTDGDTWSDGDEVEQQTDPLDPNDFPLPSDADPDTIPETIPETIPSYLLPALATGIIIGIFILRKKTKSRIIKS